MPSRWVGPRSEAMQLGVYAAYLPEPPVAVVMARLPRVLMCYTGLAERAGLLPKVGALGEARRPELAGLTWPRLIADWRQVAAALARDYASGDAAVDPAPRACERCHLQSLCRVDTLLLEAQDEDGEGDGEGDDDG